MGTITEMKLLIIDFMDKMDQYAKEIIDASDKQLVTLVQDQLMKGKDGNDNPLAPYRDEEYANYKATLNPLRVTDLKLTGSFYSHMKIWWLGIDSFSIISEDSKWRKLMKQYGIDTLKLSEESIQYFRINRFNPLFINMFCTLTGAQT